MFRLSTRESDEYSSDEKKVSIDGFPKYSARGVEVWSGEVHNDKNSQLVRQVLLAEILARTFKNMFRYTLRIISQHRQGYSEQAAIDAAVSFLNMISGCSEVSNEFWARDVTGWVISRFGHCTLSEIEKINLYKEALPALGKAVCKFAEQSGIVLEPDCASKFCSNAESFVFTSSDIVAIRCRTKHNMFLKDFSRGMMLAAKANTAHRTTYEKSILSAQPTAYWPLTEATASRIAANLGKGGLGLSGTYSSTVELAVEGHVVNTWPKRAARFNSGAKAHIDTRYSELVVPKARLQQFSVEAWASVRGGKGEVRVIVSTGRYALLVTKQNLWGMSMYDPKYGVTILVTGPAYVEGKWTHIAGTFDGTMIRLYVEGKLEGEEDMDERSRHLAHAEEKHECTLSLIDARKKSEKEKKRG